MELHHPARLIPELILARALRWKVWIFYQIKDLVREKGKRIRRCVSFNGSLFNGSQALQAGPLTALGDVPR